MSYHKFVPDSLGRLVEMPVVLSNGVIVMPRETNSRKRKRPQLKCRVIEFRPKEGVVRRPDALSEFLMNAYGLCEDTARELLTELDQTSLQNLAGTGSSAR